MIIIHLREVVTAEAVAEHAPRFRTYCSSSDISLETYQKIHLVQLIRDANVSKPSGQSLAAALVLYSSRRR